MNKFKVIFIAIILLFSLSPTFGQHSFGLRAGAGAGNIRLVPTQETKFYFTAPQVGLSYRYRGGVPNFGGIEADLTYMNKGYKTLPRLDSDSSYMRTINTLQITFLWQPHLDLNDGKATIFANLGPYGCYHLSANERFNSKQHGDHYNREYEFTSMKDNRLGYGLTFGLGCGFMITERLEIFGEVRYDWGFSDIMKNINKYPDNMLLESPMDYLSGAIGIFYRFGKPRQVIKSPI